MTRKIAIVGAGVSGLAAAVTLEFARQSGQGLSYTLFERSARLGGVMITDYVDDCIVEAGPDSFLTEKTYGLDFCRSIGLGDQIIGSNDSERKTYILVNKRLIPMPDGLMFMVPTKILPTITTPLFSWGAKIRMGLELLHRPAPAAADKDETVAEMVNRHFGMEMVERLADPLLSGVYGGDAASLSAKAVLPRFVDMEKNYGSLCRAMLASRKKMAKMTKGAEPRPLFSSLRNGMQQLVDAVADKLPPQAVRLNSEIREIGRNTKGWTLDVNGQREEFDAVILALPAYLAGKFLRDVNQQLAADLEQVVYSSSVTVNLGYDRSALSRVPPGFGFLIPRTEGRRMLAATFVHNKFPHRAPADRGIVRVFLGGLRDEAVLALNDSEILETVHRELKEIVGLDAKPRFERVYRWQRSMAQYGPGHLARVERIRKASAQVPGLALAGNALQGIGVPDCISTGQKAANTMLSYLNPGATVGFSEPAYKK